MNVIDTYFCQTTETAYTLAKQLNGEFAISDSDGNIWYLGVKTQSEAYKIFYDDYKCRHLLSA